MLPQCPLVNIPFLQTRTPSSVKSQLYLCLANKVLRERSDVNKTILIFRKKRMTCQNKRHQFEPPYSVPTIHFLQINLHLQLKAYYIYTLQK